MGDHAGVAERIGRTLVADALWHEGRCTWVGSTGDDLPPPRFATLAADLYDGVAGVGLFLAHLAAATGDTSAARVARAAIRQALWRAARSPAGSEDGLYAGPLGVALAAVRAGWALDDQEIREGGILLAGEHARSAGSDELDLMLGAAGRIVALLAMRSQLGDETAVGGARATAGRLVRRAAEVGLTGYSHGMSGALAALLELWTQTGDPRLLSAGEAMLVAERAHLDPAEGNWADLREGEVDGVRSYAVAWCHGAPGIALARLRAFELTGDPLIREEALVALATTERYARAALRAEGYDLTLCHGLSGLAEILAEGEDVLGEDRPGGHAFAAEVAEAALERHGPDGLPWPCGVPFGTAPGLMTGLAGIGLFHLRLHDPAIPSVLLIRP